MKNVTKPRTVSFEDALRNLATKLTGTPVNMLPRTQEGVVQYMAEHVPSVDEMAEAITQEVIARLAQADATGNGEPDEQEEPAADGATPLMSPLLLSRALPKTPNRPRTLPLRRPRPRLAARAANPNNRKDVLIYA